MSAGTDLRDRAAWAVESARAAGAAYADARAAETLEEEMGVERGDIGNELRREMQGIGVRVLAGGAFGFAGTTDLDRAGVDLAVRAAMASARAARRLRASDVRLVPESPRRASWSTPLATDPFAISLADRWELLFRADREIRGERGITGSRAHLSLARRRQWFVSSEGSEVEGTIVRCGAGLEAIASNGSETQTRSFPCRGGQYVGAGWEAIESLDLLAGAARAREEALELLRAPPCPSRTADVVLGPSQLALQIHESCGHAAEVDRALGYEANFAGTSFLAPDALGRFRLGSSHVNLRVDPTTPGGLATAPFDDEGVEARPFDVVRAGVVVGFLTNREHAAAAGDERSRGCARADGPVHAPIVRVPNLHLAPGSGTLDELLAGIDDGLYLETTRSWSIDARRLHFQFGCEIAWEVKGGRRTRLVRNPSYQGVTPTFWGSCDGVAGPSEWRLFGFPNCGKGEPLQIAEMSHGCSPARFRGVSVGVAGR